MVSVSWIVSHAVRQSARFSFLFNRMSKLNNSKANQRFFSSNSGKENVLTDKFTMKFSEHQVEVKGPTWENSIILPFIWLRDHCRCPKCYNYTTHQRALDLLSIPDDIQPKSCSLKNGVLEIKWPDNHHSEYPLDWLWKSSIDGYTALSKKGPGSPVMWDSSPKSVQMIAKVPLAKYMRPGSKERPTKADAATPGLVEVVQSLVKYGVAFVDDVHPSLEGTQSAINQLALIKHTLFGGMFEFGEGMDHADTAYTNQHIGVHTDNTYFKEASGLLVLHCIHHEGSGGENILVDGLRAAEALRQKHPEAHACLSEEETEAEYVDDAGGRHYSMCGPVLSYSKTTGQFLQLRFNLYDRSPLRTLPAERIPKFYTALKLLAKELNSPEAMWTFKLMPGTVMLIDNWRVLHGRNEYTGKRKMTGCYVDRGDFESTARMLGLL